MTSSSTLQDIPLSVFRPEEHLLAHIVNNVRPDGRNLLQPRPIAVIPTPWQDQSHVVSSKQVQIGDSIALGVVKLSVGMPSLQKASSGDIEFKVTMNHLLPSSMINQRRNDEVFTSSGNSSAFPGDLTPSTQEVEYMMNTVFNMGKLIDLTQLCVEPGSAVIRLVVHITVLSYAGNLRDLCFLCAILALRDVQLPTTIPRPSDPDLKRLSKTDTVTANFWKENLAPFAVSYETLRPLVLLRTAVPVTFATLTDRRSCLSVLELIAQQQSASAPAASTNSWLLDPTFEEESIADGVATFIVDPVNKTILYSSLNAQGVLSSTMTYLWAQAILHAERVSSALRLE